MGRGYDKYNKVVHINTTDVRGGAAKFVWNLHSAQRLQGLESNMVVGYKESNSSEVETFPIKLNLKIHKYCMEKSLLDFSLYGSHGLIENPLIVDSDIIHFHNLHGGYFNPFSLSGLSCIKPSVWTLHDMYPITGHCAFSFDCERWETRCGECPYPENYCAINYDSTSDLIKYKKMIYDHSILNIVTPTKWMENKVNKSILKEHRVRTIYHGIDTKVYSASDKKAMREKYGIPDNKIIIGTSANGGAFGDPRKGGYYVKKCLESLDKRGIDYAFVNIGAESLTENNPKIINAGYIKEEAKMAELYSTLDIFLFPSLSESFGLVVVEALSCGVPVIAFNNGAIDEIVVHDYNGMLVEYKNEGKLIKAIIELSSNELLRSKYANNSRISACEKFDFDRMVKEYQQLYSNCIKEFYNSDKKPKLFALDMIPEEIKNDMFYNMEAAKTNPYTVKAAENKSLKVSVIFNAESKNYTDSLTYISIMNQTYKNIAITVGGIEDVKLDNLEGDLIYYIDEGYIAEPNLVEDVVNQYFNEDAICFMVELSRENGTPFYRAILPDFYEKADVYKLNSIKHNNSIFKRDFFIKNLNNIKLNKYVTINSFDLLNYKLVKAKLSKYIEDITKQGNNSRIFVYGAGGHTIDLLSNIDLKKVDICGIIDKNQELEGKKVCGLAVTNFKNINELGADYILISSLSYETEIFEQLRSIVGEEKLIRIYGL